MRTRLAAPLAGALLVLAVSPSSAQEIECLTFDPPVVTQGSDGTVELTCLPVPPFTKLAPSDP